jgi:hypothetical protein
MVTESSDVKAALMQFPSDLVNKDIVLLILIAHDTKKENVMPSDEKIFSLYPGYSSEL